MKTDPESKICPHCGTPGKIVYLLFSTVYEPNCNCTDNILTVKDKIYIVDDGSPVYKLLLNDIVFYDSTGKMDIMQKGIEAYNRLHDTHHNNQSIWIKHTTDIPDKLRGAMLITNLYEVREKAKK